jgi:hypothetical protein
MLQEDEEIFVSVSLYIKARSNEIFGGLLQQLLLAASNYVFITELLIG